MKTLLSPIALLALLVAVSCGKKNEVAAPDVPITGVGLQQTNLLSGFDPSFESASTTPRNFNPRPIGIGRTSRPVRSSSVSQFFRVTGGAGRGVLDHEVSQVAARSGSKSLRLYRARSQTLIMPLSSRQKGSPLKVQRGARYRYQVYVRLPRGNNSVPRGDLEVKFQEGLSDAGRTRTSLMAISRDANNWHLLQAEFEVPTRVDSAKLYLQLNSSDDLLIDDVSLIRIR